MRSRRRTVLSPPMPAAATATPDQIKDANSFVSGLRRILALRTKFRIDTSTQIDVPDVSHKSLLAMVHQLENGLIQVTALNFSNRLLVGTVMSPHLPAGGVVTDMFTDRVVTAVDQAHAFPISLEAHKGMSLLVAPDARLRSDPGRERLSTARPVTKRPLEENVE